MWPCRTPGRGSGASPVKRSAGRESTTWAVLPASAACTSASVATIAGGLRARNERAVRVEAPVSSGRPSAFHFGIPPSSTNTFPAPNRRNVHHTRGEANIDRKSTRLNSSHLGISYAVFCLKKKKKKRQKQKK